MTYGATAFKNPHPPALPAYRLIRVETGRLTKKTRQVREKKHTNARKEDKKAWHVRVAQHVPARDRDKDEGGRKASRRAPPDRALCRAARVDWLKGLPLLGHQRTSERAPAQAPDTRALSPPPRVPTPSSPTSELSEFTQLPSELSIAAFASPAQRGSPSASTEQLSSIADTNHTSVISPRRCQTMPRPSHSSAHPDQPTATTTSTPSPLHRLPVNPRRKKVAPDERKRVATA